jgi:hypothetical protein
MAKVVVNCRKCGKAMKLNFEDTRSICKKCVKKIPEQEVNTSKNFDF